MWLRFWWVACCLVFNFEGRCLNPNWTVVFHSSRCCWVVWRKQQLVMSRGKWKRNISSFFSKSPGNDMDPWGSITSIYPRATALLHLTHLQQSAWGKQQHYYSQNCNQINWENQTPARFQLPLFGQWPWVNIRARIRLKSQGENLSRPWPCFQNISLWPSMIFAPLSTSYWNSDHCVNLDSWPRKLWSRSYFLENVQMTFESVVSKWSVNVFCQRQAGCNHY